MPQVVRVRKPNLRYCAAPKCFMERQRNPDVRFFGFPKDEERCKIWVQNCGSWELKGRTTDQLYRRTFLCSKHFEDSQFMNVNERKKLVWNAIPTVFSISYKSVSISENINGNTVAGDSCEFLSVLEYHKKTGIINEEPGNLNTNINKMNHLNSSNTDDKLQNRQLVKNLSVRSIGINTYPHDLMNKKAIVEQEKLLAKLHDMKKQLGSCRVKLWRQNRKLKQLTARVETPQLTLKKIVPFLKENLSEDAYNLVLPQFLVSEKDRHATRWSSRIKKVALMVYRSSPLAYKMLGKMFNMPSKHVLVSYEKQLKDLIFEECQIAEAGDFFLGLAPTSNSNVEVQEVDCLAEQPDASDGSDIEYEKITASP